MCYENTKIIAGHSIAKSDAALLKELLLRRGHVAKIVDFRSFHITSSEISVTAKLYLSKKALSNKAMNALFLELSAEELDLASNPKVKDLALQSCNITLETLTEITEKIEDDIKLELHNVRYVELKTHLKGNVVN
mmetsp:Transcript_26075/g.46310  ORF Transcript_26075/g.46310 Transcript_26075/m.46310 type:complete len:135 (+) Transcript_26075:4827-5231(+)